MRCRYCGSSVSQEQFRCQRCQRRHDDDRGRSFPVVQSAAAPDYQFEPETDAAPPSGLTTVTDNPDAPRRPRQHFQPRLFPTEEARKVVGFEEYIPTPARPERSRQNDGTRHSKRKHAPGQGSFDFTSPLAASHTATLSGASSRRSDLPVAAFRFRIMAAMFDSGFVFALVGLFLLTVRVCLHTLPAGTTLHACYAASALIIAAAYKLLYCFFGKATLGQQGAQLRIVNFDGQAPTRTQRMTRMFSGWVSLASAGIGVIWALVDHEHLSWHDHISQTFLTYED